MISRLGQKELRRRLDGMEAVAVSTGSAKSVEEFELAHYLAKSAFAKKKNIARNIKYEFLLWLCGKTDIRSAMEAAAPEEGKEFFLAVFSEPGTRNREPDAVCRMLDAEELPLALDKLGAPLALERISLSRVKS